MSLINKIRRYVTMSKNKNWMQIRKRKKDKNLEVEANIRFVYHEMQNHNDECVPYLNGPKLECTTLWNWIEKSPLNVQQNEKIVNTLFYIWFYSLFIWIVFKRRNE